MMNKSAPLNSLLSQHFVYKDALQLYTCWLAHHNKLEALIFQILSIVSYGPWAIGCVIVSASSARFLSRPEGA
jgi:hypothetical protein